MTDWPVKTLGEVALVGAGNSAPQDKELFKGGMHRFVRTSDVGQVRVGRLGKSADLLNDAGAEGLREFRAGVTLMPKSGASTFLNHRVQLTKPCFVSSHLAVVDPNPKVMDDTFIFYFLQTVRSQDLIQDQSYPSLNLQAISGIKVLVPPLEEQKRIVELLDNATARVAELTACYEQARTHANNLFTSALRDALESDQSAPLRTLDELCGEGIVKLGRGNIISKKDIAAKPGSYPIYSSARENEGKFGEYGDYMFDEEMITWSIDGGGRLFFRPKHKFSVTNVGGTLRVLDPQLLDIQYLHRVLQNLHSQRVFDWVAKAHPSVIRKVYDAIPMPPLSEQKRVVARLDLMRAKSSEMVAANDAKLTAAKNLRQSILEAAFAGEL